MKFFRWLPAFLICSFIFSQPSLTGTQSTGLSLTITEWFAHISFLLKKKHFGFYLLVAILIPLCDESIQSFTAGRNAHVLDCLIDASGMAFAWILQAMTHYLKGGKNDEHMEP